MESVSHSYELKIREGHLDSFGHVNNAVYLSLFEEARWEMITRGGYGMARCQETGLGPVILEARVKFKRELHNRQTITIRTQVTEFRRLVGTIEQQMVGKEGTVHAEAQFRFGIFDLAARRLVPPPPEWEKAFGASGLSKV